MCDVWNDWIYLFLYFAALRHGVAISVFACCTISEMEISALLVGANVILRQRDS